MNARGIGEAEDKPCMVRVALPSVAPARYALVGRSDHRLSLHVARSSRLYVEVIGLLALVTAVAAATERLSLRLAHLSHRREALWNLRLAVATGAGRHAALWSPAAGTWVNSRGLGLETGGLRLLELAELSGSCEALAMRSIDIIGANLHCGDIGPGWPYCG